VEAIVSLKKWIIVSNRLPVSVEEGKIKQSSGGLVTALKGIRTSNRKIWVGCAPSGMKSSEWRKIYTQWRGKEDLEAVFPEVETYDHYYNGFCNDLLWPLLHYETTRTDYRQEYWEAYQRVNEQFAQKLAQTAEKDDIIWIHDFHLFLLPKLLRKKKKNVKIGFFLHVPFPSSEIFRQLPHREEILRALMESDLIGFHDYSYLRHFCSTILRVLGVDSSFLSAHYQGRKINFGVFPVSIDTPKIEKEASSKSVRKWTRHFKGSCFNFLGVDRLDYMKGIELKLKTYANFLHQNRDRIGKVRLIQLAVPTRQNVPHYIELKEEVERLVGEINGQYATPTWTPIRYMYSTLDYEALLGLYRSADALLVTSKRDGMNLVCLEYIAAQSRRSPGVVLLSEFAGALSMLGQTIPVNPWDIAQAAQKLKEATELSLDDKKKRWKPMFDYLMNYTATDWANSFIKQLDQKTEVEQRRAKHFNPTKERVQSLYKNLLQIGEHIILMMDYDGTLVPITNNPKNARIDTETLRILSDLQKSGIEVLIVSGRPKRFLSAQFADCPFHLSGEHGATVYDPCNKTWRIRVTENKTSWYESALQIMEDYSLRVQHSFVEKKSYSIAWHYREAPKEYGFYQALKLKEELEIGLANLPVSILSGKKIIEVRAHEANKGFFASHFLESHPKASVCAIGDDVTDEDLFEAIRGQGYSIKVGSGEQSVADFNFLKQDQVKGFLKHFLHCVQ
jgi:trehalose 6-phosphate synthase/phosphatase